MCVLCEVVVVVGGRKCYPFFNNSGHACVRVCMFLSSERARGGGNATIYKKITSTGCVKPGMLRIGGSGGGGCLLPAVICVCGCVDVCVRLSNPLPPTQEAPHPHTHTQNSSSPFHLSVINTNYNSPPPEEAETIPTGRLHCWK